MELYYDHSLTVDEYNDLRSSVGWREIPSRQTEIGLKNSLFLTVARHQGQVVGLLRVLGDGGYTAVIADVMVRPQYQRMGIGKTLMSNALTYIRSSMMPGDKVLVYIMAAKGKESFYQRFGFTPRPNEQYGPGMTQWFFCE